MSDNVIYPERFRGPGPGTPVITGATAPDWSGPGWSGPIVESGPAPSGPVADRGPAPSGPVADRGPAPRTVTVGPMVGALVRTIGARLPALDTVRAHGSRVVVLGGAAIGAGFAWTVVGALIVVPAEFGRWVWQPDRGRALRAHRSTLKHNAAVSRAAARDAARAVKAGAVPDAVPPLDTRLTAHVAAETAALRTDRRVRSALVLGGTGAAWLGGPALIDMTPAYALAGMGTAAAVAVAVLGRRWMAARAVPGGQLDDDERPDVPVGLVLRESDQGALATVERALVALGAAARVIGVERGVSGWGWAFELRTAKAFTPAQLDELAHVLDVRRGGLMMAPVAGSTQSYVVRTILADLIGEATRPVPIPAGLRCTDRAAIATRYDGTGLTVPMIKSLLLLGQTGSGKSTTLREWLRWLVSTRCHIVGIDLAGGADLATYAGSMEASSFTPDIATAERLLQAFAAVVRDRTRRLAESGHDEWTADLGAPWVLAIDEYWGVADHVALRKLVEGVALSGRKVWMRVVLANNRRSKDVMKSTVLQSQIDLVIVHSMSPDDEAGLPSVWRAGGVRPSTLLPAEEDNPRDAGKGYVIGSAPWPELVRFPHAEKSDGRAVAALHPAPPLHPADRATWDLVMSSEGVPTLVAAVRSAILTAGAGRGVTRASVAEISAHLIAEGHNVGPGQVTRRLGEVLGTQHRPPTRDMNLPDGSNPKGFRLDEFDQAVTAWQTARAELVDR